MADSDRAIIVGIENYPFIGKLGGPENDAQAFQAWVGSPGGGAVPLANIRPILAKVPNPRYSDPVRPVFSFFDPTLYQMLTPTTGVVWSSWSTTSNPLGRMYF